MDLRERCRGARVLLLSPHLDDAVYSCGELIATLRAPVVATVFAGIPPAGVPLADWDARAGFDSGVAAVHERRREDADALASLGAEPLHLDFLDAQYGAPIAAADVANALRKLLADHRPDVLIAPLGLYHGDHRLVGDALLELRPLSCVAYEDVPYRRRPGLVQQRLAALLSLGVRATPMVFAGAGADAASKHDAVRRYASQCRAFGPGGCADTDHPETYWALDEDDGR